MPHGTSKHSLLLSGVFVGNRRVVCLAQLAMVEKQVILKIAVRSDDDKVTQALMEAVTG